jgi:hypothetical protein
MNSTTNAVAGSVTRHTMTAGGVAGLVSAQDDIIRLLSLLITVIGLGWSIWEKLTAKRAGGGDAAGLFLVAGMSVAMGLLVGCTARTLDAAGPYRGDAILYHADGVIIELASTYQTIAGLAARNPDVVANSAALTTLVSRVERELDGDPQPDEVLTQLIAARDAYAGRATPENASALQGQLSAARALLEHVRTLLPALLPPPNQ